MRPYKRVQLELRDEMWQLNWSDRLDQGASVAPDEKLHTLSAAIMFCALRKLLASKDLARLLSEYIYDARARFHESDHVPRLKWAFNGYCRRCHGCIAGHRMETSPFDQNWTRRRIEGRKFIMLWYR